MAGKELPGQGVQELTDGEHWLFSVVIPGQATT